MKELASIRLGGDSPLVTRIGMGCYQLGGHGWGDYVEKDAVYAVEKAIEQGVTFFDTADVYGLGRSEQLLGGIIANKKGNLTVATKGGVAWDEQRRTRLDNSPAYLRSAVEKSLWRLGVDGIDLYYLHWKDGITPLSESVGTLFSLQKEGKIRRIGLSNITPEDLKLVSQIGHIHAVQVQANILRHKAVYDLAEICKHMGTTLVTWGSLADGLLTGKYNSGSFFGGNDHRSRSPDFQGQQYLKNLQVVKRLRPIAEAHQTTLTRLALRWVLDMFDGSVALFGAKSPPQVLDNLQAEGWHLTKEECRYIAELNVY